MSILRQWAKVTIHSMVVHIKTLSWHGARIGSSQKSFKQGATDFCSSQIEQDVNGKYEHSTWNNRLPLIIRSACMIETIAWV